MREAFASGRVLDLILLLMLAEATLLGALHWRTGRGIAPLDLCLNLAAGALLVLAVRAALVSPDPLAPAPFLGAALVAHLGDLARRWRG
jgi:hypothetical protein